MNRVVHFEMHSGDPQKTSAFFGKVFGWQSASWSGPEEYWLLTTGDDSEDGINGGLMTSRDGQPRTVNTLEVESVDDAAAKVVEHGGQVVVEKMAIPGVGYVAYCVDPCGVLFGIHHPDPSAH